MEQQKNIATLRPRRGTAGAALQTSVPNRDPILPAAEKIDATPGIPSGVRTAANHTQRQQKSGKGAIKSTPVGGGRRGGRQGGTKGGQPGRQGIHTTGNRVAKNFGVARGDHYRPGYTASDVAFSAQKAGAVIWRPEARDIHDGHPGRPDEHIVHIQDGLDVLDKARFFLIAARNGHDATEYPMSTHGDQGLAGKTDRVKSQHNSIKPLHIAKEQFLNQAPGQEVLEMGNMVAENVTLKSTSVVCWTKPKSRSVDCDQLRHIGDVTPESIPIIFKRAREFIGHPGT